MNAFRFVALALQNRSNDIQKQIVNFHIVNWKWESDIYNGQIAVI